jgi:acetyl esterase/lipase
MLQPTLVILALLCSTVAAFMTVWIVVPPLHYRLFLVAVGASEWSLWFGLLGLLGALLGLMTLIMGGRLPSAMALILGVVAVALALIPPLQARRVAQENGVRLSLRQYFSGLTDKPSSNIPQTVTYATIDGKALNLDIYLPEDAQAGRPAIIIIHGGSWSGGVKSDFPWWNHWFAQHGFAVFDIEYRIAPQPNWQTATADVKCAIAWVKRNAARYGVDPERIALLGRSAGGHLALLAAYTSNDSALPPSCEAADTSVRAVISVYGATDLNWGYANPTNLRVHDGPGAIRHFIGGDPHTAAPIFKTASPITHVSPRTPPTLLLHGGHDQLVNAHHMRLLSQSLQAAGVPHRTVLIPYAQHGFDYNLNGWSSQIVQPIMLQFLETHLNGPR